MEKIGIIDIGTNSMRLMIGEVKDNKIIKSYKTIETTRLGQGINKSGRINSIAFKRNFNTLKEFKELARAKEVEELLVFGTSALRDATNSDDFIDKAKKELGISIRILTGKQEAEIGFKGVISDITADELLVIDIGGGSTEFILGNKKEGIIDMMSFDMGALRMSEGYIAHDPIRQEELNDIERITIEMLVEVSKGISINKATQIVGIGGTITTLSAIKQSMKEYDWKKIHHSQLNINEIKEILEKLRSLSIDERKKVWGLQPSRADIIIAGTIILKNIMKTLSIKNIVVSESDNLEGMLYNYLQDQRTGSNKYC